MSLRLFLDKKILKSPIILAGNGYPVSIVIFREIK